MTIYYADSSDPSQDTIIETLCGYKLPQSYELRAAGLRIGFKSDRSYQTKGFQLRYQSFGNGKNIRNNEQDSVTR